jgi:hypothetical protein
MLGAYAKSAKGVTGPEGVHINTGAARRHASSHAVAPSNIGQVSAAFSNICHVSASFLPMQTELTAYEKFPEPREVEELKVSFITHTMYGSITDNFT